MKSADLNKIAAFSMQYFLNIDEYLALQYISLAGMAVRKNMAKITAAVSFSNKILWGFGKMHLTSPPQTNLREILLQARLKL